MATEKNKTLFQKLLDISNELGAIGKDRKNNFQGFQYRGVEDVMNGLNPLLIKHKVIVYPNVREYKTECVQGEAKMTYRTTGILEYHFVDAETGDTFTASVLGEGNDTSDKASYKAMSGAIKYALFQTLMIPTEDDPDKESPVTQPKEKTVQEVIEDLNKVDNIKHFNNIRNKYADKFKDNADFVKAGKEAKERLKIN